MFQLQLKILKENLKIVENNIFNLQICQEKCLRLKIIKSMSLKIYYKIVLQSQKKYYNKNYKIQKILKTNNHNNINHINILNLCDFSVYNKY